jgi:hypothetical protein
MKIVVFWNVTPWSLTDRYQCFARMYYLSIQDLRTPQFLRTKFYIHSYLFRSLLTFITYPPP